MKKNPNKYHMGVNHEPINTAQRNLKMIFVNFMSPISKVIYAFVKYKFNAKNFYPNSLSPVIVITTLGIANTIIQIAALAFFGLGDATAVTWGDDLAYHRDNLLTYWWMPTWPAVMIFITILGFNLMGDALLDAIDPKQAAG